MSAPHPATLTMKAKATPHLPRCSETAAFISVAVRRHSSPGAFFFLLFAAWWIMCNSLCVFMRQSLQTVCDAPTKGETIVYSLIGLPLPPVLVKLQKFHCSVAMAPWKICRCDFPFFARQLFSLSTHLTEKSTLNQFESTLRTECKNRSLKWWKNEAGSSAVHLLLKSLLILCECVNLLDGRYNCSQLACEARL